VKTNFFFNYLKIYFWQGLSIILSFLSMFVVTPFLSTNQAIFGIYSVCVSISIFLSYADLGFMSAGQKYASEEYARDNRDREQSIVGFAGFILLIFVLICSVVFFYFAIYPQKLIPSMTADQKTVATQLLLILACFSVVTVFTRISQMIYSIRIEDYMFQRITICGSLVKIASVFAFFNSGKYNIVGYFLFMQIINLGVAISALVLARMKYSYSLKNLFRAFKFNIEIFNLTKTLAFSGLFLTASWILYYECDNFVIGYYWGASAIAIYAIGFSLMTFLRSMLGTLFSPFVSRFNHYIGVNDEKGLKESFSQLIEFTFPVVSCTVLSILLLSKPLIFTWVGPSYVESVNIATFLLACNIFAFITYPCSLLLSAQVRVKLMYLIGALLPFIYWIGIFICYHWLGLQTFAVFKFVAFCLNALLYLIIAIRYLKISPWKFFKDYILKNLPSLTLLCLSLFALRTYLPLEKSKGGLLLVIGAGATVSLVCIVISYAMNIKIRTILTDMRKTVKNRN